MPIWTPLVLSNLGVWLDANDYTSTQTLTTWTNKGSAGSVTCTGELTMNKLASKPVVYINSSPRTILSRDSLNYTAYSLFGVCRQTGGQNARILNSTSNNQLFGYWNNTKACHFVDNNPGFSPGLTGRPVSDTNWNFLATTRTSSGPYIFRWDGSDLFSAGSSSANSLPGIAVNSGATVEASQCEVAEIVLYSTVLALSDVQRVEGYLAHKWGLAANLPSNHPHKNAAPRYGAERQQRDQQYVGGAA